MTDGIFGGLGLGKLMTPLLYGAGGILVLFLVLSAMSSLLGSGRSYGYRYRRDIGVSSSYAWIFCQIIIQSYICISATVLLVTKAGSAVANVKY